MESDDHASRLAMRKLSSTDERSTGIDRQIEESKKELPRYQRGNSTILLSVEAVRVSIDREYNDGETEKAGERAVRETTNSFQSKVDVVDAVDNDTYRYPAIGKRKRRKSGRKRKSVRSCSYGLSS